MALKLLAAAAAIKKIPSLLWRPPRPVSFKRLLGGAWAAPRSSAAGFLVKTELIPRRIGEYRKCAHACADIRTRRQNAPPCSLDPLERIGDSIHHDIGPCPFVSSPIALLDPCAAHSAGVSKASSPSPRLLTFQPKMLL